MRLLSEEGNQLKKLFSAIVGVERKSEGKGSANIGLALNVDICSMDLQNPLCNGKTEPCAVGIVFAVFNAVKAIEDMGDLFFAYAAAVV